jgi:hypothetical protein
MLGSTWPAEHGLRFLLEGLTIGFIAQLGSAEQRAVRENLVMARAGCVERQSAKLAGAGAISKGRRSQLEHQLAVALAGLGCLEERFRDEAAELPHER